MIWQDTLISLANFFLIYSAFIQVHKGFKEKKKLISFQTALFTAAALYSIGLAFFTLELIFSALLITFNAILWTILFYQSVKYK